MPKPITPMVSCEVFVMNDREEVLLVRRADDGTWCMPGGCQELNDTPAQCAARECREESGYEVRIEALLGVFSSLSYPFVHYKFKDDVFTHLLFSGRVVGGSPKLSAETLSVGWFALDGLPLLLDDHSRRIRIAFERVKQPEVRAFFE